MVPNEVLRRDLNVGTATAGGNLVDDVLLSGSFIELLRNRLALAQAGMTTLSGINGNISIPKQGSSATAYWVGEGSSPTESQQTIEQINLSPKTCGAFVDYSRKLLLQSSIDVEQMVRDDLARVLALELDRVGSERLWFFQPASGHHQHHRHWHSDHHHLRNLRRVHRHGNRTWQWLTLTLAACVTSSTICSRRSEEHREGL